MMSYQCLICLLCFSQILIHILIGFAHAGPEFKGAEALMQIQRVLDLSAEISKAEEVTIGDISTAESKYTKKRQYAVPDDLLRLVDNTITDLKSQQASAATESNSAVGGRYVTAAPDIRVQSEESGNYAIVPYSSQQQREEQSSSVQAEPTQQYALQQSPVQYALPQGQQYALSQDQLNQYALQSGQVQQYSLEQSQGPQYSLHPSQEQQYTLQSSQGQGYGSSQGQQYSLQHEQVQQYSIQPESGQQYAQQSHRYAPAQAYQHQQQYSLPPVTHYQVCSRFLTAACIKIMGNFKGSENPIFVFSVLPNPPTPIFSSKIRSGEPQ